MLKTQEEQNKVVVQRDILRQEVDDARLEVDKLECQIVHQKQVEKMLECNVSSYTEKFEQANKQLNDVRAELKQMLEKYAIAEEQVGRNVAQISVLKIQLTAAETRLEERSSNSEATKQELFIMKQKFESLRDQFSTQTQKVEDVLSQVRVRDQQIDLLKQSRDELQKKHDMLYQELASTKIQLEDKNDSYNELDKSNAVLQSKYDRME